MADTFRIYLSGGMKNLSFENQTKTRCEVKDFFNDTISELKYKVDIFNPPEYFNYHEPKHISEKQVFLFELNQLRNSKLVIVDFNDPLSLGTMTEISIAYENRIPVIGLNMENKELHPRHIEICDVIFDSIIDLCSYIKEYYLI